VIGPKGAEVDKLREELEEMIKRKGRADQSHRDQEPRPQRPAGRRAIAEQLKKRASFRRVLKMRMESTMQAGAKGIKICVSGRLGGAEIARRKRPASARSR
jgi:small subunit ribosomal protein S3